MRKILPFITLLFLSIAPLAHAEERDIWDFQTADLKTGYQDLTKVELVKEGIHIQTDTDGFLYWEHPLKNPADILTIRILAPKSIEAGLLWHPTGEGPDMQADRYISISGKDDWQDVDVALTDNVYWDYRTDKMAFGIPKGSDIVLQGMIWRRYSVAEKLKEAWKSFWTFDTFNAYSINFLWGPLLASNPLGTMELFQNLPPTAWSINRIFYAVLAIAFLMGIVFYLFDRTQSGKRKIVLIFWGTFVCLWIVFDLRMGAEVVSYAVNDIRMHVLPAENEKAFRTHEDLYTIVDRFLPTIRKYDRYVLLTQERLPYYQNFLYQSYPSVLVLPSENTDGIKVWAVIKRSDISVNAEGRLTDANGNSLSPAGSVIDRYSADTFLFATP